MPKWIDSFLDRITMYRLVVWYLLAILGFAAIQSWRGLIPYPPVVILFSAAFLWLTCVIVNRLFAWAYDAPVNPESSVITALILACIIAPATSYAGLPYLFLAAALASGSKYILAINRKHLFNPAALAVALLALASGQAANWWVGTGSLVWVVLLGGLLVVHKVRRWKMVSTFLIVSLLSSSIATWLQGFDLNSLPSILILQSPYLFFACVMLTEPLTTPPSSGLQVAYASLVSLLFTPQLHISTLYTTPELALLVGNLFSFAVSPKARPLLTLEQVTSQGQRVIDFAFRPDQALSFKPGQYMEWTLPHSNPDSRGSRRYFTIASSPTEPLIHLGVTFNPNSSSFKQALQQLPIGSTLLGSQLAGEFTLPPNAGVKMLWLAGGIGITPFRSMTQYLLDTKDWRDIALIYAAQQESDFSYREVFDRGVAAFGLQATYVVGRIDFSTLKQQFPDLLERRVYLSGPHSFVTAAAEALVQAGVVRSQIKEDFFPGLA